MTLIPTELESVYVIATHYHNGTVIYGIYRNADDARAWVYSNARSKEDYDIVKVPVDTPTDIAIL
jgi:hypothetical protein